MTYLTLQGKQIKKEIANAKSILADLNFDTIAVRGSSGLLFGAPLAMEMEKNLLLVRKEKEVSHSTTKVEGKGIGQRIIVVDDFVETGKTLKAIEEAIITYCQSPTILGLYLYNHSQWTPWVTRLE